MRDIKVGLIETFAFTHLNVSSFYETTQRTTIFADFRYKNNQTTRKIEEQRNDKEI
jgi:hypothetical protein